MELLKLKLLTEQLPDIIVNIKKEKKLQQTQLHQFMLGPEAYYTELNLIISQTLKISAKNWNKLRFKLLRMANTLKI
jgi:hypothetical protein